MRRLHLSFGGNAGRFTRTLRVTNATKQAGSTSNDPDGSYDSETPEWNGTTTKVDGQLRRPGYAAEALEGAGGGSESLADVEIVLPDEVDVYDGDEDDDRRATHVVDVPTGRIYVVTNVFLDTTGGVYICEGKQQ